MSRLLEVTDLTVRYGAVVGVQNASFHVDEGELVVVVGANGAGKSSLMRGLAGLHRATGTVCFSGTEISRLSAERRVRAGVVLVPEGRHLFERMTVLENLQLAGWGLKRGGREELERVYELFPVLAERQHQLAATLSGGEQQMLALARALVRRPKLLMLDEPSIGLAPLIVEQMFRVIAEIHSDGTSVLLVEQNARRALAIANRGYVMAMTRLSGGQSSSEMLEDDGLASAYFGTHAKKVDK